MQVNRLAWLTSSVVVLCCFVFWLFWQGIGGIWSDGFHETPRTTLNKISELRMAVELQEL